MNVVGGVNYDAAFVLPLDIPYRGEEDAVDEAPDPAREDQDELVVNIRDYLFKDSRAMRGNAFVIVVSVTQVYIRAGTEIVRGDRRAVLQDMKSTVEVLNRVAGDGGDTPSFRYGTANGIQGDVVVGVDPSQPPDEVANVEV